jgi:hypothetical protein
MPTISHPPITARGFQESCGMTGQTTDVVASFLFHFAIDSELGLNHGNTGKFGPFVRID